jgi:hypothetical protein
MLNRRRFLFPFLGIIALAGLLLILLITPHGSGVQPDSIVYLSGAKNLLAGKGFVNNGIPITHFPPLYSLFLAAMGLLVKNLVQAARILNAILFGINTALVALAVYLATGRRFLPAALAGLFFLASAPILVAHAWALSEPLFITFSLSCILLLSLYIIKPTWLLLITSSLLLGLAILTRYMGIGFLPAAVVIVFAGRGDRQLKIRFRDTFLWGILACAPFIILSVVNMLAAGSATDRTFVAHPASEFHYLGEIFANLSVFLAPIALPVWVWPAFLGLLAGLFIAQLEIFGSLHLKEINWRSMEIVVAAACLLFSASFLLFLFLSISYFDASTSVDSRILSPLLAILIVAGFSTICSVTQILKKPMLWRFFLICVVIFLAIKIPDAIQSGASIQKNGLGYTATAWQESASIAYVKSLPGNTKIYSNGADVIGFITENQFKNPAVLIPRKKFPTTTLANPSYNQEVEAMCKDIQLNGALLLYMDNFSRPYLPNPDEVQSACKLSVLLRFADGTVYGEK